MQGCSWSVPADSPLVPKPLRGALLSRPFQIAIPADQIAALCRRWHISQLALFGSVLREDFRASSDIDILVTFHAGARPSVFDLSRIKVELAGIFGRKVDLVEHRAVEESDNYLRRKHILESAEVIYGS
jgi:uncharacterized protein